MPDAVLASPAQRPSTAIACSRTMPGVWSVSMADRRRREVAGPLAVLTERSAADRGSKAWRRRFETYVWSRRLANGSRAHVAHDAESAALAAGEEDLEELLGYVAAEAIGVG